MSISNKVSSTDLFSYNIIPNQQQYKKPPIQSSRPPLSRKITTQQSQRYIDNSLNLQKFEKFYAQNAEKQQSSQNQQEKQRVGFMNCRRNSNKSVQEGTNDCNLTNQANNGKENDKSFDQQISNAAILHQRKNLGSKNRIVSAKPFNNRPQSGNQRTEGTINLFNRSNSLNKNTENKKQVELSIQIQSFQKQNRDIQSAKSSNNSLVRAGLNIISNLQYNQKSRVQSKQSYRDVQNNHNKNANDNTSNIYFGENDQTNTLKDAKCGISKQISNDKLTEQFQYKRQKTDTQLDQKQKSIDNQTERLRRLNSIQVNVPLPHITAQSWTIYDVNSQKFVQSKKESYKREVASITKVMTFYTCLQLMEKYNIDSETLLTVSRTASRTNGTSACLREGDQLSINQLFYGLMLPSGNDAAYCLAEYFGQYLQQNKYKEQAVTSFQFQWSIVRYFLKEMNLNAYKLRMFSSQYDSPHGLANKHNYSTAQDICLLATKCMQIEKFRQVVNTIEMKTEAKFSPNGRKLTNYNWENTNKLLGQVEGFIGCKTGITNPAGPCFCGGYEKDDHKYIVVVLCSKSMESRWVEVPKMIEWALKKKKLQEEASKIKYPSKYEEQSKIVRIL